MTKLSREVIIAKARGQQYPNLTQLNICGLHLTDVSILENLKSLEILVLSVNDITTLRYFKNLENLRELYLRKNCINDLHELCHLVHLQNLQVLSLIDNPCASNAGPNYIHKILSVLPNLTRIDDIYVTDMDKAEAEKLGDSWVHERFKAAGQSKTTPAPSQQPAQAQMPANTTLVSSQSNPNISLDSGKAKEKSAKELDFSFGFDMRSKKLYDEIMDGSDQLASRKEFHCRPHQKLSSMTFTKSCDQLLEQRNKDKVLWEIDTTEQKISNQAKYQIPDSTMGSLHLHTPKKRPSHKYSDCKLKENRKNCSEKPQQSHKQKQKQKPKQHQQHQQHHQQQQQHANHPQMQQQPYHQLQSPDQLNNLDDHNDFCDAKNTNKMANFNIMQEKSFFPVQIFDSAGFESGQMLEMKFHDNTEALMQPQMIDVDSGIEHGFEGPSHFVMPKENKNPNQNQSQNANPSQGQAPSPGQKTSRSPRQCHCKYYTLETSAKPPNSFRQTYVSKEKVQRLYKQPSEMKNQHFQHFYPANSLYPPIVQEESSPYADEVYMNMEFVQRNSEDSPPSGSLEGDEENESDNNNKTLNIIKQLVDEMDAVSLIAFQQEITRRLAETAL